MLLSNPSTVKRVEEIFNLLTKDAQAITGCCQENKIYYETRKRKGTKARTGCCQEGHKKHIASENVSCGYFTLLVQHEFAGGLADRCAEETGEEGMILET